jgi:hypothetical protein
VLLLLLLLQLLLLLEGHHMHVLHLAVPSLEPAHLVTAAAAAAAAVNASSLGDHNSSQSAVLALTDAFQPRVFEVAGGCHLSC